MNENAYQTDFGWPVPTEVPDGQARRAAKAPRKPSARKDERAHLPIIPNVPIGPIVKAVAEADSVQRAFIERHIDDALAAIEKLFPEAYEGNVDVLRDPERRAQIVMPPSGQEQASEHWAMPEQSYEATLKILDMVIDEINKVILRPIPLLDTRISYAPDIQLFRIGGMQGACWLDGHREVVARYLRDRLLAGRIDELDLALGLIIDNGITDLRYLNTFIETLRDTDLDARVAGQCPYVWNDHSGQEPRGTVLSALNVRMLYVLRYRGGTRVECVPPASPEVLKERLGSICESYSIPWPRNRSGARWLIEGSHTWFGMRQPPFLMAASIGRGVTTDLDPSVLSRVLVGRTRSAAVEPGQPVKRTRRRRALPSLDTIAGWAVPLSWCVDTLSGIRNKTQLPVFKELIDRRRSETYHGWDHCVYSYVMRMVFARRKRRAREVNTNELKQRWVTILRSLIGSLNDEFPEGFAAGDHQAWHEGLTHVGQYGGRKEFNRIYEFYRFVGRHQGWSIYPKGEFFDFMRNIVRVDANLLSYEEFCRVRGDVVLQPAWQRDERMAIALALELGFFAGLRWSECIGLRMQDIQVYDHAAYIDVLPSPDRSLKTGNAIRRIPYHALADSDALGRLIERRRDGGPTDALFLGYGQLTYNQLMSRLKPYVHNVLRRCLRDSSLRYHHLRHSFANWVLSTLILDEGGRERIKAVFRTQHPVFCDSARDALVRAAFGLSAAPGAQARGPMLVAALMGHLNPETTLKHYVHLTPFLIAAYRCELEFEDDPELNAILFGLSRSQAFKKTRCTGGNASLLDPAVPIRRRRDS